MCLVRYLTRPQYLHDAVVHSEKHSTMFCWWQSCKLFTFSFFMFVMFFCSTRMLRWGRPGTHYSHVTWAHVILTRASWDVRGDLALKSVAQIHTSVALLTSRDLAWSSGRLTCQHASQISTVAHISWDVTYVSSALQTLPVVSRNGGNAYWKSAPTDLFIWHQVTRL
jgi:hypothetical protein